ncbi:Putative NADH-dependent dehydrogenase [Mesoflavibacter sp. HG96]|uniref:Gfo/Idh/MocA family protein n=1 Tax=Mesoflavibacter TaxID=444051 RepID=UPI000D0EFB14|nr:MULTISPECIES: Gfo/Idh/MocA family oxidoreductase [Mesoflavibacter]QIJ88429.1 Putative NADH-dependent dehydrogenase [Mesoflavibacter sp. HG96]QIJ91157.1 Putative NADH-dependent dehydrogenase [Mesoflavibacter sp. HG37]
MKKSSKLSRRTFIKSTALTTFGISIVPRHVLGKGYIPPSDKLNVAVIGAGGKGYTDMLHTWNNNTSNITAICDVDWNQAEAAFKKFPNAKKYKDYRKLLENQKDFDAVTISTPDHTHAVITLAAMQNNKDVYVQKPLTHNIYEARVLTQAANKYKIVTQMGNQGASGDGVKTMINWFNKGLIGNVSKVHIWTNRPVWPQGIKTPTEQPKLIDNLDWDTWVGPASWVDYHPLYHPFKWRGWWNFGTGALGDMGCHLVDPPYRVLGLGYPTEVESSVGAIFTKDWTPDYYPESCPPSSRTQLKFEATEKNPIPVKVEWTDGGLRPFHPDLIPADHPIGDEDSANGVIMIGEKGIMTCGTYGMNPKVYLNSGEIILPEETTKEFNLPENGHHQLWVDACKDGFGSKKHKSLTSSFDFAGPLTESILMGNLAIRSYNLREQTKNGYNYPGRKKLLWDGNNMKITNFEAANQFVKREYRDGWSLNL